MNLHVSIGGDDVTALALFSGTQIQKDSTDAISTATLVFRVDHDNAALYDGDAIYDDPTYVYGFTPREWQEVVLTDDGGDRHFAGYIVKIDAKQVSGNITDFTITCSDYGILCDRTTINETYSGQSDEAIILDAFASVTGITVDAGDVATLVSNLGTFEAKDITLRELMERVCELTGGEWRVNYDGELLYYASGSITAPFGVSDEPNGTTTFPHRLEDLTRDFTGAANRITVLGGLQDEGAELVSIEENLESQLTYGILSATVTDRSIPDQETADLRAAAEIAQRAFPLLNGRFVTYKDGLDVGQTIHITNAPYALDQSFVIRSIGITFITEGDSLDLGGMECRAEYVVEFGQKVPDILSALRRLERRTRQSTNPPVAIPAPLSVTLPSLASTIAPVVIVNAKPVGAEWDNYPSDTVFFLTSDRKLYRRNGSDWTRSILAADMTDQVVAGQLAADSVIAGTVAAGAIRASDAAFDAAAIQRADLALAIIGTAQIDNLAVTSAKIDNLAVTNAKINDLSASKLTAGTIDASVITVTNLNASNITTGGMSAARITTGTLDASVVSVINLNASNITTGTMSASRLTTGSLVIGSTTISMISTGVEIVNGSSTSLLGGTGLTAPFVNVSGQLTLGTASLVLGTGSVNISGSYWRNGVAGYTGTISGAITSITVSGGIITAWS